MLVANAFTSQCERCANTISKNKNKQATARNRCCTVIWAKQTGFHLNKVMTTLKKISDRLERQIFSSTSCHCFSLILCKLNTCTQKEAQTSIVITVSNHNVTAHELVKHKNKGSRTQEEKHLLKHSLSI